jgi:hypothetical protein
MSDKYYSRFKTEEIFLWNKDAGAYVRSKPGEGYFARFPGKKEFPINYDTDTVVVAIDMRHEVSEREYYEGGKIEN